MVRTAGAGRSTAARSNAPGGLSDPAERQRRDRDAKLGRCKVGVEIVNGALKGGGVCPACADQLCNGCDGQQRGKIQPRRRSLSRRREQARRVSRSDRTYFHRNHYHEHRPPEAAFSTASQVQCSVIVARTHDSAWSWRSRRGRETSASIRYRSPGQAVAQPPLMWGRVTGPASGSTRLASALRLCSSAPHGGALTCGV